MHSRKPSCPAPSDGAPDADAGSSRASARVSRKPRATRGHRSRRSPGRPRRPLERAELLAIARGVFARHGYAGTRLNVIAERAGIRAASLFNHFESKEALYREVLAGIVAELADLLREARLERGDPLERLDRLGSLLQDYLAERSASARLLLREMMDEGPFIRDGGRAAVHATMSATAAFLAEGMEAGVFRRQDPHQLAISILGVHALAHLVPLLALPSGAGPGERGADPAGWPYPGAWSGGDEAARSGGDEAARSGGDEAARSARKAAVLDHVRRLCCEMP